MDFFPGLSVFILCQSVARFRFDGMTASECSRVIRAGTAVGFAGSASFPEAARCPGQASSVGISGRTVERDEGEEVGQFLGRDLTFETFGHQ